MVKSSPHALGRARERYVMKKYQEHGWDASIMPGSAWGSRDASCQPVDIKAFKLKEMTEKDWNLFFEDHYSELQKMKAVSDYSFKVLLRELIECFLEWKKRRDERSTVVHYVQVKKDKDWLTDEEKKELVRLSDRDGALPVFVYSYAKSKRLRRYKFENVKTGEVFGEEILG